MDFIINSTEWFLLDVAILSQILTDHGMFRSFDGPNN